MRNPRIFPVAFGQIIWHSHRVDIDDKRRFKLHLAFLVWWIDDKYRFTLHLVNQWQAITHLHPAFGPGEPLTSTAWVSAYARPPPPIIPTLKKDFGSNPAWWEVRINITWHSWRVVRYLLNIRPRGPSLPPGYTCFAGLSWLLGNWGAPIGEYWPGQIFLTCCGPHYEMALCRILD